MRGRFKEIWNGFAFNTLLNTPEKFRVGISPISVITLQLLSIGIHCNKQEQEKYRNFH